MIFGACVGALVGPVYPGYGVGWSFGPGVGVTIPPEITPGAAVWNPVPLVYVHLGALQQIGSFGSGIKVQVEGKFLYFAHLKNNI